MEITSKDAERIILDLTPRAIESINAFSQEALITIGGRIGSGMGTLFEALWCFHMNQAIKEYFPDLNLLIGWLSDNQYNDFACVKPDEWDQLIRYGEYLRIEAKSMNSGADESKAHFDEIMPHIGEADLLLVLVWSWHEIDNKRFYPYIADYFIGNAREIAYLRDELHIKRGGSFVSRESCPDGCRETECKHDGEPLNKAGVRERASGPNNCVTGKTKFAANFGGLVRMLKVSSNDARACFKKLRHDSSVAHEFISFIHRNFPTEEINTYTIEDIRSLARLYRVSYAGKTAEGIIKEISEKHPDYKDQLRLIGFSTDLEQNRLL